VAEADVVISVPKLKTHGLTVLTGAVKNPYGAIPGFRKAELHKLAPKPAPFSEIVADVYEAVRPDLTVMDAVVALEGDGPSTKGAPRKIGALLAGTDAVAIDAVAGAILGLRENDVPTTAAALRRGLGAGIDFTDVVGSSIGDVRPDGFRHASSRLVHIVPTWAVWLLGRYLWVRPHVLADKCVSCGLCIETCPVEAISPGPDMISRINHDKCIECLACVESCPEDSIEQKVSWLAKRFT
jgi:ferredoxin